MKTRTKKTILEICNFSSGISGVWTRAIEDAREFVKQGYDVHIYSSNETETGEQVASYDNSNPGIAIKRFPIKKRKGYALWFDFEESTIKLNPDIIICHGLRKPYLEVATKIAKKIGAKAYCVTHAPFIDKNLRSMSLNMIISIYDNLIGKKIMNSFDKIITICKWENEILIKLGCDKDKIEYIPNSLSDEFFKNIKTKENKKILFLGRMHPIKELDTLIRAFDTPQPRW